MKCRLALRTAGACLISLPLTIGLAAPAEHGVLVNQFGLAVPASALRGKVLLVYFGFSRCAELCPSSLLTMGRALKILGPQGGEILPLFVSIDPGHDTPAQLRGYLAHFDPRIRGLTGTPTDIAEAAKSFAVQINPPGSATTSPQFDHSVFIYLTDRRGLVVRRFLAGADPGDIAAALRTSLAATKLP